MLTLMAALFAALVAVPFRSMPATPAQRRRHRHPRAFQSRLDAGLLYRTRLAPGVGAGLGWFPAGASAPRRSTISIISSCRR